MNDKNKNLVVRIVAAAVLLPLVLFLIGKGGYACGGLLAVAAGICAAEYYLIVAKRLAAPHVLGILGAASWPLLAVRFPLHFATLCFWLTAAVMLSAWVIRLLKGPLASAPVESAHTVMGMLYAGFGLTALSALRNEPNGLSWVVAALTVTWANDTSAYFAGRLFGRHKLYPEVSPNKTWEGFAGGLLGSVGGLFIARAVFFPHFTVRDCLILGGLGGVLGPLGDLSESMLKRAYQVKDSGHAIPGHGGVLDRIDALLFNAPLVYVYVTFLMGFLGG